MPKTLSVSLKDYSRESSTAKTYLDPAVTPPNLLALINAISGVSSAVMQKTYDTNQNNYSTAPSAIQDSRRERKLLVRSQDNVTLLPVTFTIPSPDMAKITMQQNSDYVDMTAGAEITALIAAVNLSSFSLAGNAITIVSMEIVGRNL